MSVCLKYLLLSGIFGIPRFILHFFMFTTFKSFFIREFSILLCRESEKYNSFFEKKIDELIAEAEKLEQDMRDQKNLLKEKLQSLSKTLTMVSENES